MTTNLHPVRFTEHPEEFVDVLSRQTRSAMHTILGMLQLIADSPLSTSQQDHIRTCRIAADNLLRMVDDVSVAAWQPELSNEARTAFDLHAFLKKVEGVFRPAAEADGRRFSWTMQPGVPERVVVSEALLEQFVIRLIGRMLEICGPAIVVDIETGSPPGLNGQVAIITVRLSCTGLENTDSALEDVLGFAITRKMAGWLGAEVEAGSSADGEWHVVSRIPMQLAAASPAALTDRRMPAAGPGSPE